MKVSENNKTHPFNAIGLINLNYLELGHAAVGVLGFRVTELKHAIGLTNLNYLELGHAAVGVLGREAVGVLKGRPRLSHHVSHCVAPPAAAIGLLILMTRFSLGRLMPCSSFQV